MRLCSFHSPSHRQHCRLQRVQAASCAASVVESSSSFQTASNGHPGRLSEEASSTGGALGAAAEGLTFQEAVMKLQQYWAEQAECVIYMPTNTEVLSWHVLLLY